MRRLILAFGLALAASLAVASDLRGNFSYAVTLDGEGRVIGIVAVDEGPFAVPPPALDAALRQQLSARHYVLAPALEPPVRTWLDGEYRLVEEGDDYMLRIDGLRAGPRLARMKPPKYPIAMIRGRSGADVVLELAVDADGSLAVHDRAFRDADLSRVARNALERAVDDSLAGWRYEPEADARGPLPGRTMVAIQLRITALPTDPGLFEPLADVPQAGNVRVPDEDYSPLTVQVTGSRVRRR